MFNAERLLGNLITTALTHGLKGGGRLLRHNGVTSAAGDLVRQNKAAIGMGILGLAVGAYEHFIEQKPTAATSSPATHSSTPVAPMPQNPGELPPLPVNWTPPPLPTETQTPAREKSVLLLRAMVASANADHAIDASERQKIVSKVAESGLGEEGQQFLAHELSCPLDLQSLVAQVDAPEMAEQVYVASVLAVEVDSDAERNYLRRLADLLKLDPAIVQKWNQQFGLGPS